MIRRAAASLALTAVTLLVLAAPALAGGWAITSFDALPAEFRAGETYRLGYTVLQHGQTPVRNAQTAIRIRLQGGGETLSFPGRAEGAPGHYVAQVRFPTSGTWTWEVDQGGFTVSNDAGKTETFPFEPQRLLPVTVLPAVAVSAPTVSATALPVVTTQPSAESSTAGPRPVLATLRLLLPLAALAAVGVFGLSLLSYLRRGGRVVPGRPRQAPEVRG
jgi:hypothetical protein